MARNSDYDIVCIGFGPAGLSLAIALAEQHQRPKVAFFEKNASFVWRAHDFLPGKCRVRNSLLQDLVTARNPLSQYTFINYLWATDNLVGYTNLGAINPPRALFARYLEWCAENIGQTGWIRYGEETTEIEPVRKGDIVDHWRLTIREVASTQTKTVTASKVVLAVGVQPKRIQQASTYGLQQRILHTSHFGQVIPMLNEGELEGLRIAVIGSNDEAVEVYDYCCEVPSIGRVALYPGENQLRPLEKSPFTPTLTSAQDSRPHELRRRPADAEAFISESSVHQDAHDGLYNRYYAQLVEECDVRKHRFQICQDIRITEIRHDKKTNKVMIETVGPDHDIESLAIYDYIFLAARYERSLLERLMKPAAQLFDSIDGRISAESNCKVNFRRDAVANSSGVWVLDGFADGAEDSFPFLALRTEKVLWSLLSSGDKGDQERSQDIGCERTSRATL